LNGLGDLEYIEEIGHLSRNARIAIGFVAVLSIVGVAFGAMHIARESQAADVRQEIATACGVELWRVAPEGYATDQGTRYNVDVRGLDAPGNVAWAVIASDDAPIDCQLR
jgi:hypothetical protein